MVFDHFAPLIAMWCSRTEVTARVFWSNVGNTFEAMLRRIETVSGPSERLSEAQRLLATPDWLGERNPLFDAVRYLSDGARRRRVCCLQYLLPDRRFCKACPIEEARAVHYQEETTS
jgi:ferric iron reductase protein FhuF